jgi:hypothetical protein
LAAAQASRDELMTGLQDAIGKDDHWLGWLNGGAGLLQGSGASAAADRLASDNDATVTGFDPQPVDGFPGYQVTVKARRTVGNSVIPGIDLQPASAVATAVIQPRCTFASNADPKKPVVLDCHGQTVGIDPTKFRSGELPDASVLFSVHLIK